MSKSKQQYNKQYKSPTKTYYKIQNRRFEEIGDIAKHYSICLSTATKWMKRKLTANGDMIKTIREVTEI